MRVLNKSLPEINYDTDIGHALLSSIQKQVELVRLDNLLLANARTNREVILKFFSVGLHESTLMSILGNPKCPIEIIEHIVANFEKYPEKAVIKAVKSVNASKQALADVLKKEITFAYRALSNNKNATAIMLRLLCIKTTDESIHLNVFNHPALENRCPNELLAIESNYIHELIAKSMILTESQVLAFLKKPKTKYLVMQNINLSEEHLRSFYDNSNDAEKEALAKNSSLPVDIMLELLKVKSLKIKASLATNESLPLLGFDVLSKELHGNIPSLLLSNKNAPEALLNSFSHAKDKHLRELVAAHENTPYLAFEKLAFDDEEKVRAVVSKRNDLTLPLMKKISNDSAKSVSLNIAASKSFGILTTLKNHKNLLVNAGNSAFDFFGVDSPKKTLKMLINSKHPSEVEFVFNSSDCESVYALSALQSAFTNNLGKINRSDYLLLLDQINKNVPAENLVGLNVEPESLALTIKHFDTQLIIEILAQFKKSMSVDCFRMLASLVSFENKSKNRENKELVTWWLGNAPHNTTNFHDYLSKITKGIWATSTKPFFQASLAHMIPQANLLLDDGFEVGLPMNPVELGELGEKQNHCVGSRFYGDRCADGSNIIFQIRPRGDTRHGLTFQYSRGGRLLQAQGYSNERRVSNEIKAVSKQVFNTLMSALEISRNEELVGEFTLEKLTS